MRCLVFIFFIYSLTASINIHAQNGWTRKAKSFYIQGALTTFNTNQYWTPTNTLANNGATFHSHAFLLYGEYGVTDKFNVILDAPLLVINHFTDYELTPGVGNIKLGLKYRFFKDFPLAFQFDFDIPTDDGFNLYTSKTPDAFGNYNTINVPTSDGEFNFHTTLAVSQSTKSGNTFASAYVGANWRTKGFSHLITSGIEIGQFLFNRWFIIGKFKIQEVLIEGNSPNASIFWGEGTTFSEYNFTNMVKLNENWSILAGMSDFIGFPSKRRNIYDGVRVFLGVSVEY